MKKLTLLICFCWTLSSFAQEKRVLFLGNSYTYGNNLPNLFENLSTDGSHTVFVDSYTAGGQLLDTYANAPDPQNKIKAGNWDVVIIQEQSMIPTIPFWKENWMRPAAHQLEDTIRKYNPCATIMMFMTWGRRYGGQQCLPAIAPYSTAQYCSVAFTDFSHMQDTLASAYLDIAEDIQAAVAPVGIAWEDIILNTSTVLHTGDNSHPNNNGSYLAGCVFYAMIWKESPVGLASQAGVEASLVPILQESARKTVFDGSFDWDMNIDSPQAKFSYEQTAQTVDFENQSISTSPVNSYLWDFGDGNTSNEENPSHTYHAGGNYMVTLTVTQTVCNKADTFTEEISIPDTPTNLREDLKKTQFVLYPNPSKGNLQIKSSLFLEKSYNITVLDNMGKQVLTQMSKQEETQFVETAPLKQGKYLIRLQSIENKEDIILNWIKIE